MTPPTFDRLLITCEHASNGVPKKYAAAFRGNRDVLRTHRAWDPGAVVLAKELAKACNAKLHEGEFTRLLIDLNRREESPKAFSEFTPPDARDELRAFHRQWREGVLRDAANARVLHISCHSFTPVLNGVQRNADIGLLYDPGRPPERATAQLWHEHLKQQLPHLRIRRNYPYRGTADGLTTWLRKQLRPKQYAGFEIELNQAFSSKAAGQWAEIRQALIQCAGLSAKR